MKKFLFILIILLAVAIGGFGYFYTKNESVAVLQSKTLFKTEYPVNAFVTEGSSIVIGTAGGKIYSVDLQGKTKWTSDIKTNIFGLSKNDKGQILVCSVYFYLLDGNGKTVFSKGYRNYIGVKGKFISNGNMELVYQSLNDLSYIAVETDKKGKTISKRIIPDLGESSHIDILSNGNVLFSGSRGEIYVLDQKGIVSDTVISNRQGNLHSIYAEELSNGNIVCGYTISADKNPSIPVYFFDKNLKKIKTVTLHSNINNVSVLPGKVIFATDEGFYIFNNNGELVKTYTKFGFCASSYSENNDSTLLLFYKPPESKKNKPILSISILKNGKKYAKYLFSADVIPFVELDDDSDVAFLIRKNNVELLYKK